MKYIFDFDDVLFNNTSEFKEHMFATLAEVGVPESEMRAYYLKVRAKEFSLLKFIDYLLRTYDLHHINSKHIYEAIMLPCPQFLNHELVEEVKKLGKENCYVVTNGDKEFNRDKIRYSGIWDLFKDIKIVPGTKREAVTEICNKHKKETVIFSDNRADFIDDIDLKECHNLRPIIYDENGLEKFRRAVAEETSRETSNEIKRK